MRVALPGALAAGALLLTGCVSAAEPSAGPPTPSPSRSGPQCDVLTVEQLQETLGVAFVPPRAPDPSSTATTTVCQWTATDQTALVITKVLTGVNAKLVFRSSFEETRRTLGPTETTDIPGATSAFRVPSLGRTAMLVGNRFVEVSVLVPSATPARVADVAAFAARSLRRG